MANAIGATGCQRGGTAADRWLPRRKTRGGGGQPPLPPTTRCIITPKNSPAPPAGASARGSPAEAATVSGSAGWRRAERRPHGVEGRLRVQRARSGAPSRRLPGGRRGAGAAARPTARRPGLAPGVHPPSPRRAPAGRGRRPPRNTSKKGSPAGTTSEEARCTCPSGGWPTHRVAGGGEPGPPIAAPDSRGSRGHDSPPRPVPATPREGVYVSGCGEGCAGRGWAQRLANGDPCGWLAGGGAQRRPRRRQTRRCQPHGGARGVLLLALLFVKREGRFPRRAVRACNTALAAFGAVCGVRSCAAASAGLPPSWQRAKTRRRAHTSWPRNCRSRRPAATKLMWNLSWLVATFPPPYVCSEQPYLSMVWELPPPAAVLSSMGSSTTAGGDNGHYPVTAAAARRRSATARDGGGPRRGPRVCVLARAPYTTSGL